MYELLDTISGPADLKKLSISELRTLCEELRGYIVECCSHNPGHLASSLGAVEMIVGWHYVFNAPSDKLVFDVGHQAYAHKILTGRREAFASMRTEGGISGFPNIFESEFDAFGVGHSSTSISAALGLAEAAKLQGRKDCISALIGDGALTGGLALEGLNNAGASKADLLVILNDNNQSIDGNLGGLHNNLLKITTSSRYNRIKDRVWNKLGEGSFRNFIQRWIRSLKSWLVKKSGGDLFEALGFRYFGPIDGNDIGQVISTLQKLQKISGPRILHCCTIKGKGYEPAEKDPVTWHAPGKFDVGTGQRLGTPHPHDRFQDVFGGVLCELAQRDSRVVGITPAMAQGSGMSEFAQRFPERFFDVGIEEEHAVTFSAGLAAGGMRPFCNIYSAFSQRAYDQIIHDAALQKLPVVFCFDRAGVVGEDGATHHGMFDLAAYRSIPGVTVCAPRNEAELKAQMYTALQHEDGPYIIRYPRGMAEGSEWRGTEFKAVEVGKAVELLSGSDVAVLALGPSASRALDAAASFPGKVGVYDMRFLKPLDCDLIDFVASRYRAILTLEDGTLLGGLHSAVCEHLAGRPGLVYGEGGSKGAPPTCGDAASRRCLRIVGAGAPDVFIPHGRQSDQLRLCGLDTDSIRERLSQLLA